MFGALKFRDEFCFVAPGIPPAIYAAGSTGGTAIPVTCQAATSAGPAGNYMDFKKWVFINTFGSTSVGGMNYQAWVGGASASGGTFSMLPATSMSAVVYASTSFGTTAAASGSVSAGAKVVIEVRGEYLSGLNSSISWIKPIISISGGSANLNCESLAFLTGSGPARNGDYGGATTGIVLTELDAF